MDGRSSVLEAVYAIAMTMLNDSRIDERVRERMYEAMQHVADGAVQAAEV